MITPYHAKYYAYMLSQLAAGGDIDSLSQSLMNAAVDINPHQIEAALFAFQSPLTKGVILADEVGLGKTIEAGLVICQYLAVGKRKIIIVCPVALRKQWSVELFEKFGLDNEILDTKNYNEYVRNGKSPYDNKKIVICSYNFAARKQEEIRLHGFQLAVIDEAHKMRNAYKKGNKTAQAMRDALVDAKKLLLTATPFQNSLMELYGLTSVIDENLFGDSRTFRAEYVNEDNISDLRERIAPYYKRTLRRDVTEYINYTKRLPLTQQFEASNLEQELYLNISEFLRRDDLYSIPAQQRMLTTMIIRKILASSTYALLGTLHTIKTRLEKMFADNEKLQICLDDWLDGADLSDFTEDTDLNLNPESENEDDNRIDRAKLKSEIDTIDRFIHLAESIHTDSKAQALLKALENAFAQLPALGAERKALIFTESTRTQQYLKDFLSSNGYDGKIVLFNGSNSDKESNAIYQSWVDKNFDTGRVSGIKTADRRAALVDYFKETAEIMIATEAAAEGLNLQFCSLIVNYDLPWNPQRIEQRIGRCHRYGQKCDVVVVNFVNSRNYADQRVFSLLSNKFKLFDDVFGASDEILGQTDSVDFEKRIWAIYQECRTDKEISAAFEKLQNDMEAEIKAQMDETCHQVLENFDIDVQELLKVAKDRTSAFLNRYEYVLWELTKYELGAAAEFDDMSKTFRLKKEIPGCHKGLYSLLSMRNENAIPYRLSSPLAQFVLEKAKNENLKPGSITFSAKQSSMHITLPETLQDKHGYIQLSTLSINGMETEEYSLLTAYIDDGKTLTQEECEKLFLCDGSFKEGQAIVSEQQLRLQKSAVQHAKGKLQEIESRNLKYFEDAEERIFRWEKDMIGGLEHELDIIKRQLREQERHARSAQTIEEKLEATKKCDELQRLKRRKRNELADREDEVADQRRAMIDELDKKRISKTETTDIFTVQWCVC